jgi:hypothetical protein
MSALGPGSLGWPRQSMFALGPGSFSSNIPDTMKYDCRTAQLKPDSEQPGGPARAGHQIMPCAAMSVTSPMSAWDRARLRLGLKHGHD